MDDGLGPLKRRGFRIVDLDERVNGVPELAGRCETGTSKPRASRKTPGETKFRRCWMQGPVALNLQFENLRVILHQGRMMAHAYKRRAGCNQLVIER